MGLEVCRSEDFVFRKEGLVFSVRRQGLPVQPELPQSSMGYTYYLQGNYYSVAGNWGYRYRVHTSAGRQRHFRSDRRALQMFIDMFLLTRTKHFFESRDEKDCRTFGLYSGHLFMDPPLYKSKFIMHNLRSGCGAGDSGCLVAVASPSSQSGITCG